MSSESESESEGEPIDESESEYDASEPYLGGRERRDQVRWCGWEGATYPFACVVAGEGRGETR